MINSVLYNGRILLWGPEKLFLMLRAIFTKKINVDFKSVSKLSQTNQSPTRRLVKYLGENGP